MNPPLSRADKRLGIGTLLLLGLAGVWLGQPQQPFQASASGAKIRPAEPVVVVPVDSGAATQAAADVEPLPETQADTTFRFTTYNPLTGDTLACPHTYRRYLGTLNGKAIVVHLSIRANTRVQLYQEIPAGSWYYRYARQPAEHPLLFRRLQNGLLVLTEGSLDNASPADTARTQWQFSWPLRRRMQGHRRADYGARQQLISLREDYSQAVRYELPRLTAHSHCWDEGMRATYYSTEFLHLLSADSLRLARWQAPPPAARRNALRGRLNECEQVGQSCSVTLNDYGLLSYSIRTGGYYFGAHPGHDQAGTIVDLATGRNWLVQELLRPGTEPALRQLLARHLRRDYPELNKDDGWHWRGVPPLPGAFVLSPTGLYAGYGDYALAAYLNHYADNTPVPYAELRPLVRPGTPLARLLLARGMW